MPCGGRSVVKSLRVQHHRQDRLYFIFFRIIEPILVILKIEYRLSRRYSGSRGGAGEGGRGSYAAYYLLLSIKPSLRFS